MKILMVCLGNICRSPLAHGVLQHLADNNGLAWTVESAGTGNWHVGDPPDRRTIAVARQYGIDISGQRAQQFQSYHFDEYDHILVMDRENLRNVLAKARTAEQRARVQLFLPDDEVPDPYFDDELFDPVYKLVEARCKELVEEWSKDRP
ncbi:low molecular weight protein-tyrosine-phosphatase [Parapedobacter soli]|uniref:low molecular weight protein-tyrosine-phosphatase n=1 Tax=Parapedobacter soli TaxID=416955 RepID=UPI0021C9F0F4|nr:low molecular weight protein-tyrosine-phosphatase [Parapedobacter soli]